MPDRKLDNIRVNLARGLPDLDIPRRTNKLAISIVGTAPNVDEFLEHEHGTVMGVNKAHDWLLHRVRIPHYTVFLDSKPSMVDIIDKPHKQTSYLCASMVAPELLDKLQDYDVQLWHCREGEGEEEAFNRDLFLVGGGDNVGSRAISLAYCMGYRTINCYGLMGSFKDDERYAPGLEMDSSDEGFIFDIDWGGKRFRSSLIGISQAESFYKTIDFYKDAKIMAYGEGLIPYMSRTYYDN